MWSTRVRYHKHVSRSALATFLTFPLNKLSTLQRHAWGIPSSATSLVIRLAGNVVDNQESVGFCIHMTPNGGETDNNHHRYRYAHSAWSNAVICSTRPNILTYVVARELHELLQTKCRLRDIYETAASVVYAPRPGSKCVVCRKDFGDTARLWRPLPCGDDCSAIFAGSPIDGRLSVLIGDPKAVDLMLSSVYQLALEHESSQESQVLTPHRLPGCPIPLNILKSVIESFPALPTGINWDEVLDESDEGRNRRNLLAWIADSFPGFLSTAPRSARVSGCGNTTQFLLANSSLARETAFSKQREQRYAVFHGTKASRVFSIMSDGLKDLARTNNGLYAFRAHGIFVSNLATYSLTNYSNTFTGWKNSQFRSHHVLLGCELADSRYSIGYPHYQHSFSDQSRVMIRSVFLVPDSEVPQFRDIGPELQRVFGKLHAKGIL